jgi:hypothetical protein
VTRDVNSKVPGAWLSKKFVKVITVYSNNSIRQIPVKFIYLFLKTHFFFFFFVFIGQDEQEKPNALSGSYARESVIVPRWAPFILCFNVFFAHLNRLVLTSCGYDSIRLT